VFSALLFITQQSQNWEEGCVLLDVLRFQQIKVFISKENHVPKKVSKRGREGWRKDYITLASRLSALGH